MCHLSAIIRQRQKKTFAADLKNILGIVGK
jgi:hypothetical protein